MDGNPNEWAVAFHAVKTNIKFLIPKILKEGLRIG